MPIWIKIVSGVVVYTFLGGLTYAIAAFHDEHCERCDEWGIYDIPSEDAFFICMFFPVVWVIALGKIIIFDFPKKLVRWTFSLGVLIKYSVIAWLDRNSNEGKE